MGKEKEVYRKSIDNIFARQSFLNNLGYHSKVKEIKIIPLGEMTSIVGKAYSFAVEVEYTGQGKETKQGQMTGQIHTRTVGAEEKVEAIHLDQEGIERKILE